MITNQATSQRCLLLEFVFLRCCKQNNSLRVTRWVTRVLMSELCRMKHICATEYVMTGRYVTYEVKTQDNYTS